MPPSTPPTPYQRLTFYYSYSNYGFSETWYRAFQSDSDTSTIITNYLVKRLKLLTPDVSVTGVRISKPEAPRTGMLLLPGQSKRGVPEVVYNIPTKGTGKAASFPTVADQAKASMQVVLAQFTRQLGIRYLFGIPDEVSQTEPANMQVGVPPQWWADFDGWRTFVTGYLFAIRSAVKPPDNPEYAIQGWVQQTAAPNLLGLTIDIDDLPGVAPPDRIIIRTARMAAQGFKSPNGTWQVHSVVEDAPAGTKTVYLLGSAALSVSQIKIPGLVRYQVFTFLIPNTIAAYRVGTHARGGSYPRPRGRRVRQRFGG